MPLDLTMPTGTKAARRALVCTTCGRRGHTEVRCAATPAELRRRRAERLREQAMKLGLHRGRQTATAR